MSQWKWQPWEFKMHHSWWSWTIGVWRLHRYPTRDTWGLDLGPWCFTAVRVKRKVS